MEQNSVNMYLFRPFVKIAGWKAFGLGLILVLLTAVVGKYANVMFDGVIDIHFTDNVSFAHSFLFLGIDVVSVVICMYVAGLLVSRNFRFIDILGTMTLARTPLTILAVFALFVQSPDMEEILHNPMIIMSYTSFIILIIITIPIVIWFIALMYNAFVISVGAKGIKMTTLFIVALIAAVILSKTLIHLIV
jgi:hypothetical protein